MGIDVMKMNSLCPVEIDKEVSKLLIKNTPYEKVIVTHTPPIR